MLSKFCAANSVEILKQEFRAAAENLTQPSAQPSMTIQPASDFKP